MSVPLESGKVSTPATLSGRLSASRDLRFTPAGRRLVAGLVVALLAATVLLPGSVSADSSDGYVPRADSEVVASLSADVIALAAQARRASGVGAAAGIAAESGVEEQDPAQLLRRTLAAYDLALRNGSPRAYGHALALVEAWPQSTPQPVLIRVIKADILQHNHAFDDALIELAAVLETDPGNPMALKMQPQVSLVAGYLDQVPGQCQQLARAGFSALAFNCQAQLLGLTGHGVRALEQVDAVLMENRLSGELAFELHVTAADIARRLNRPQVASHHYRAALNLNPASDFVTINYADLLLEQGRASEAAGLLQARQELAGSLEMQVVNAIAQIESGQSENAQPQLTSLKAKVSSLQQRGSDQPFKLIARYALEIANDFDQAHNAARINWQVQKEPSDTLLLAKAAVASGNDESLIELARWKTRTGLQDYRLDALLEEAGLL